MRSIAGHSRPCGWRAEGNGSLRFGVTSGRAREGYGIEARSSMTKAEPLAICLAL